MAYLEYEVDQEKHRFILMEADSAIGQSHTGACSRLQKCGARLWFSARPM